MLHLNFPQKMPALLRGLFGECLHIRLHLLADIFPFIIELFVRRELLVIALPIPVIVYVKLFLQRCQFLFRQIPFLHFKKDPLCIEHMPGVF